MTNPRVFLFVAIFALGIVTLSIWITDLHLSSNLETYVLVAVSLIYGFGMFKLAEKSGIRF